YLLANADQQLFRSTASAKSRDAVIHALLPYVHAERACGTPLKHITRHILGLYQGQPGARLWRRHLSEGTTRPDAGPEVLEQALGKVQHAREKVRPRRVA